MFAIVLGVLCVAADAEPSASKEAPRLVLMKLEGDHLIYHTTVATVTPVQKTIEVDDHGKKVTRIVTEYVTQMQQVTVKMDPKRATITTAGGKALDLDALKKRLAKPQVVVLSGDGKPIDGAYLKVFDKDAIVIVPKPDKGKEK